MRCDITHNVPRRESGHLPRVEIELALQEFKNSGVWVAPLLVAVNHVVMGLPCENLRVARIREPVMVSDFNRASQISIACNRAVAAHQSAPEKRHYSFPAPLCAVGPVLLIKRSLFNWPL